MEQSFQDFSLFSLKLNYAGRGCTLVHVLVVFEGSMLWKGVLKRSKLLHIRHWKLSSSTHQIYPSGNKLFYCFLNPGKSSPNNEEIYVLSFLYLPVKHLRQLAVQQSPHLAKFSEYNTTWKRTYLSSFTKIPYYLGHPGRRC